VLYAVVKTIINSNIKQLKGMKSCTHKVYIDFSKLLVIYVHVCSWHSRAQALIDSMCCNYLLTVVDQLVKELYFHHS
jgi:hypothetical protein